MLLQPSQNDEGDLKYDMRVIASNVEYFLLARDDPTVHATIAAGSFDYPEEIAENVLKDSVWAFDGHGVRVWPNVQDLLSHDLPDLDTSINVGVDFYPFSVALHKGLLTGAEAELTQRRYLQFSYFRTTARVRFSKTDLSVPSDKLLRLHSSCPPYSATTLPTTISPQRCG